MAVTTVDVVAAAVLTGLGLGVGVVFGAGVVTTRLTGPERTVNDLVNTLPIRSLCSFDRVHRLGHFSEGMVAMHRLSVHWTYICKEKQPQLTVRANNENILHNILPTSFEVFKKKS